MEFSFTNDEQGNELCLYAGNPNFDCGTVAGNDGYCLDLDGISDFLKLPSETYCKSDFTFETWFLKRNNNSWSRIFDFGNGPDRQNVIIALSTGTSRVLSFHVFMDGLNRSFELDNPAPLNVWTHLAVCLTAHIAWVYINGNLVKLGLLQQPPNIDRNINYIGRSNWNGDKAANVLLDEFRLWKTSLDPAVIKAHYRNELVDPSSDTNLVLYYDFNEGSGTVAHDASSGEHHASCYGYPGWYPIRGAEIYLGFYQYNFRPDIMFERLESDNPEVIKANFLDFISNSPTQVVIYGNPADPTHPTDTISGWPAGWLPVYDNWTRVGSIWIEPDEIIRKEMIPYYGEPFEVLEEFTIGRFITPYGIGLTLGG